MRLPLSLSLSLSYSLALFLQSESNSTGSLMLWFLENLEREARYSLISRFRIEDRMPRVYFPPRHVSRLAFSIVKTITRATYARRGSWLEILDSASLVRWKRKGRGGEGEYLFDRIGMLFTRLINGELMHRCNFRNNNFQSSI